MEFMKVGLDPEMDTSPTFSMSLHYHAAHTAHRRWLFSQIQPPRPGPEGLPYITLWHMKNSFNDSMRRCV